MNENDRKIYKPVQSAGHMKCPKCNGDMKPVPSKPQLSVCGGCGFRGNRVKLQ